MAMMSRSAQAFADVEIACATFPRMDDCNSSADGFTMGGFQLIGSLQLYVQHGMFEQDMKSLHKI